MKDLLRRLFLVDLLKGMWLTFRYQAPKNIYTEQYPLERPMVAERYRGAPRLNMNPETGESLCIACNLCALACPENLIVVGWLRDDATRRKVLTTFTYDTSRCMFCGLCEDACPTDALELTQDFEMAYYSREGAIWDRHRLEEGPTPTRYTRQKTPWKFAEIPSHRVGLYQGSANGLKKERPPVPLIPRPSTRRNRFCLGLRRGHGRYAWC